MGRRIVVVTASPLAHAAEFPGRPEQVIVLNAPDSAGDVLARVLFARSARPVIPAGIQPR